MSQQIKLLLKFKCVSIYHAEFKFDTLALWGTFDGHYMHQYPYGNSEK